MTTYDAYQYNHELDENISKVTVKFTEELEEEFQESVFDQLLSGHRFGLLVMAMVCAIFALLDWLIMPELRYLVWSVRFLGIMPFLIISIMLTYWKPAQPYTGFLSVGALLLSSASTVAMMIFAQGTVAGAYFAGVMIYIMICYGILRLDFIASLISGTAIVLIYNGAVMLFGNLDWQTALMHNFLFVAASILGGIQTYTRNTMVRKLFVAGRHMHQENDVLAPLFESAAVPHHGPAEEQPTTQQLQPVMQELFREDADFMPQSISSAREEQVEQLVLPDLPEPIVATEKESRLEQELKDAGKLFNLFMERISDVVWFADPEGRFLYVSSSSERVWGHSARDLINRSFRELMTRESYEYLSAEIASANRVSSGAVRPLELEFVTKNRVVKTGETVVLAFQNHETYGSGVIGVTRDVTFRRKTEHELKKFNEELETLIKKRSGELEDTLKRLRSMEEAMKQADEAADETGEEPAVIRYLRGNLDVLQRQVVQLQDSTKQLQGIYSIKAMRKEDLESYLKYVGQTAVKMEDGIKDSFHKLNNEEGPALPVSAARRDNRFRFRLGDYIEQVVIGFGAQFKRYGHMVEIDCSDQLEVYGDPLKYADIFKALVGYSLEVGLAEAKGGSIEIQVFETDSCWSIRYCDDGKGMTAEALDRLFEKPYQEGVRGNGLQQVRNIVRDELDGEFRLTTQKGILVFEIDVPKLRERTA